MTDFMDELYRRLREIGFEDPRVERVVMDVQRQFAGEQVYIISPEAAQKRQERMARNRAIIRAYKDGEQVSDIARRHRMTTRMVWKIIKG